MKAILNSAKDFLLDLLFPIYCINCQKEDKYLCQDCQQILEISENNFCLCKVPKRLKKAGKCQRCQKKKLNGLYSAIFYQNFLAKSLIQKFKYQPYLKDLAKTLTSLIINHFELLAFSQNDLKEKFSEFKIVAVPQDKKSFKKRGYNQAEEIAKELSKFLEIPLIKDCLIKIKKTLPQAKLKESERKENIKGAFFCQKIDLIKKKKILIVDDVFTTGATLEECAKVLKEAGAKEVWAITVAREI